MNFGAPEGLAVHPPGNKISGRVSSSSTDGLLTLPGIILPGGGSAYPSGYLITWWRKCLPFRISYYLVDELLTLPDILLPGE
jgi:hypothetical protein